ncbi:uncharacterized protein LOC135477221 [Liolophura sinensis]|uniref:uncharacterized protein LOC135477221 n=1 Tax=Liolophura sinensis TaxID=3198878 RepID=UPI003158DCA5
MTNRYQPVGGEHRPMVPDSTRYVSRGSHIGRGGPFPHWYRGHPPSRFPRRPPIRRRGHLYHPRDVYDHLSDGDWRRDKHASSRNYSGRHSHNYDYYRRKHGEHRPLPAGVAKSPGRERSRGNQWHQMYGPQRSHAMPYQSQNMQRLSVIDFSADDTAWESLRVGGAITAGSTRDACIGSSTSSTPTSLDSLPTSRHSNGNDTEKHYQTNSGNVDSNCKQSNNCSNTKDTTDSLDLARIQDSRAEADLNCVKDFPGKQNRVDAGGDKVELARESPTLSANTGKENSYDIGMENNQNSSVTTEIVAAQKISNSLGESVPENIQSVLSKHPVVKLTRLSAHQLLKYSVLNPCSNSMGISTTQSVPKSRVPKKDTVFKEGTEAHSEMFTKHTFSPHRNEVPRDLDGSGTNNCGVTEQDSGSNSLTVDPKVMPMSLVLHTTPGAERAEDKVFTPTKPRTSVSEKGPVKKTHVGHVDINKLKERLREAMASRNSHIMKKFSLHKAKNETKLSPADLPCESGNADGDKSGCKLKLFSDEPPPSLEPECESVKDVILPIPDLTSETQRASIQPSDSQNQAEFTTPDTSLEQASEKKINYELSSPRRPESITVSLEDACKACEALVDYVPKVVVLNGPGVSVVSVSSKDNVTDCTAEDTIRENQSNYSVNSNTGPDAIPSSNSASTFHLKAGEDTHTADHDTMSSNSSNRDPTNDENPEERGCNNSYVSIPGTESVDTIDEKSENPAAAEDPSLPANSTSVESISDPNNSVESVIIDQTACDQVNTLVSEGKTGEMKPNAEAVELHVDSSDSIRDPEGEQSAVDAAEGLLCLAKSGVKIFGAEEKSASKDVQQNLFNSASDDDVSGIPVQRNQEFSGVPLITNAVNNAVSVQQSDGNISNLTTPGINKTQVTPNSLQASLSSSSLVVTQPSALPLTQPITPPDGHGNAPTPHTAIPQPAFLVLGALQLRKKIPHKVKPRKKMKRENVLRPLLPKTNGSDLEQRTETDTVLSSDNTTVDMNKRDTKILETESELLDLSMKTNESPPDGSMMTSDLNDGKSDFGQTTTSEPNVDACTGFSGLAMQNQSSIQDGAPQSTSPNSLIEKNSSKTDRFSPVLSEIRPDSLQQEGEISKHRLKLLISNLRETLGKKMPLHPMNLRVKGPDVGNPSGEGDPAEEEESVTEDPPKKARNAKRSTRSAVNSARKNKRRRNGAKRKTGRRNVQGRTKNNATTTKSQVFRRRTPKANVVVKDFYTRLRAKTEGKLSRAQLTGRKQNRRQACNKRGVRENETDCLAAHIPETLELKDALLATAKVDLYNTDTPDTFVEEGRLVIDSNLETLELTNQLPQQEDPSVAIDMTLKQKPIQSRQRKIDGRRKKKGRRNHLISSLEEYKKKLGCEDTDDLPTILPPKRRRTQTKTPQPPKKAMEDPLDGNISRLAREFPRHNWLENKIKNITAGQKTSSDTNSSPSPVPTTSKPPSPSSLTDAKSTLRQTDDCPPPLTPIGSASQTNCNALDMPDTDGSQQPETTAEVNRNLTDDQRSRSVEQNGRSRDDEVNGEEFVSESREKVPFTATIESIIHHAKLDKQNDPPGDMCRETANSDADGRLTGQNGEISAGSQRGTPAALIDVGSVSVTERVDDEAPEHQSGTENSDATNDPTVSAPLQKTDGSDNVDMLSNSNPHLETHSEMESLQTDKGILLSDCALTISDTSTPLCREGESRSLSAQIPNTDDPQVPLNLCVKPLDRTWQPEKNFPVNIPSEIQSQNTEASVPLAETMKNGPPVLKVLPLVKQGVNSSPEEFVSSVKHAMRCSAELIQTLSTPQAPSSQGALNEGHPSQGRGPVPPVPALVPLSVASSKWPPLEQCASNESQKEPGVVTREKWAERRVENSRDSGILRSSSADSVAALSGPGSTHTDFGHLKRSSLNGGEIDCIAEPSFQEHSPSSPPSTELQVLIKEFKGLEKKAEETEKELKKILSLRKQKKEELVYYMRQRLGVSRNTDSQCRNVSLQPEEQDHDPDWTEVFQVRELMSSPAEYSEIPFCSANRNNNNTYNIPCSPQTPESNRLRHSSGDPFSSVSSDSVKNTRSESSMLRPSGKRHRTSTGIDLSAKRRLVSGQVNPPQAHSKPSVDSVWTMMDIPSIQASKSAISTCPYVQSSTHEVPEYLKASDQSLKAHPAHSQKPFEIAGVIITAQPDDRMARSQRPHVTHISGQEKGLSSVPIKSGTIQQTHGSPHGSQINEPNSSRPAGTLQDRPPQFYCSGPPPQGLTDAVHMKLPVASPTKHSCSEQLNPAASGYSEKTRTMLEYVDLRKSPENIVRRVPLPPGLHFGTYPSEKFSQTAPIRSHGLPTSVQQNSQILQHRTTMASEKEQNVQRELAATIEKQRRSKLHDHDSLQPHMVPWQPTSHPGNLIRRPDGASCYPQSTTSGLMAPHMSKPHPATSQGKPQPSGNMIYTMPPYSAQVRPAKPMPPGNQTSVNTTNPFSDKPQFVAPGQKELTPGHSQFLTHPRGTPVHYAHPPSAEVVMAGRGGVPVSSAGHHPPQLVQALVSPPMRPRMSHFMPPRQKMPDPRGIGQGQTFFKVQDAHNPSMRPPNAYRPEGSYHPQRYPNHNVPIQQFAVPNSSAGYMRMPSSNNVEVVGKFVELPRRNNLDDRPPGYLPSHHIKDLSGIHTASGGPQPQASGRPTNQSPQQQHPRLVSHSPSKQGSVRQSPVNHGHLQENPMHQAMTHLSVGHHTSVHQSHVPQSSAHQIAAHPFADRQPTNQQFTNRTHGRVPSQPKGGESGQKRQGSRSTDFNCAECNRKANMICSRCESIRYCSRECQIKGWLEHGQHCKPRTSTR